MTSSFPHRASKKRTRRHKKKKSNPFAYPRFQKATPDTSGTTNFPRRAGRQKRKKAKKSNPFQKANVHNGDRFSGEDAANPHQVDTSLKKLLIQPKAEQDPSATSGEAQQRQVEREDSVMKEEDGEKFDWANFGYETDDFDPLRDEDRVDWSVCPL